MLKRWELALVLSCVVVVGCSSGKKRHPTPTPTLPGNATATATPLATATASPTPGVPCTTGTVATTSGSVCGFSVPIDGTTARAYLGIPFGESTAVPNRWAAPVPKASMPGVFPATAFGPICPQPISPVDSGTGAIPPQSEDCLSINIWTPPDATTSSNLPVMVYIYGGAYIFGGSASPTYNGAYLAAKGNVILVTFNYRIGALGFLAGIEGLTGNYGFLDQQLALNWVKENIVNFGGDPSQVTIFGESAGAISVGLHLLSAPASQGLFVAGLMESNPFALPSRTVEGAKSFGETLQFLLGCSDQGLECLEAKSAAQIIEEETNPLFVLEGIAGGFGSILVWAPVIDGTVITSQPVESAQTNGLPKPTLLGTNLNEGTIFVAVVLDALKTQMLSDAAYRLIVTQFFGTDNVDAILQLYPTNNNDNNAVASQLITDYVFFCANRFVAQSPGQNRYAYEFSQVSSFNYWPAVPLCDQQVCHADELPYVFHSATDIMQMFTPAEELLSQEMVAYWTNFSRAAHDPNGGTLPNWPEFSGNQYLILNSPITVETDPEHNCTFWDTIGYDLTSVMSQLPSP